MTMQVRNSAMSGKTFQQPANSTSHDLQGWSAMHTMNFVAYDIASPRRLRKVAKTCELYGVRVEKSLFVCDLTDKLFEQLWQELLKLVDEKEDFLLAFPVNKVTIREIRSAGHIPPPPAKLCFIAGCA